MTSYMCSYTQALIDDDQMMFSDQQLIIMRLNVLFQAQTQRQMQTTTTIQISTRGQITPPHQAIMKLNISFQAQAKKVTIKQALK